ncbi:hypothetical protein [Cohnella sp.]|uniref:hypothetical protein n=1 Tax=Cohnella sp. TaxID=1883426 RepID=UPI003562CA80
MAALFQGKFVMSMGIPQMRRREKAMKACIWGMMIAGGFYLSIVTITIAVFLRKRLSYCSGLHSN